MYAAGHQVHNQDWNNSVEIQSLHIFFSKLNILLILVWYHDMLASSLLIPNSYIEIFFVTEARLMLEKDHFRFEVLCLLILLPWP
jgi:hypothetical protein